VLFSSNEVAKYINDRFEPAWESVRPAPLVTIDFGNGNVVKRTLQGNIATYVCGSDGIVYDVLPGIYAPDVYRKQLEVLRKLADSLRPRPGSKPGADARLARLREYHTKQAAELARLQTPPQMQAVAMIGGGFKGGIGGFQALGGFGGNFGGGGFQALGGFAGAGTGFGGTGAGVVGFGGIEGPVERVIAGLPPPPGGAAIPQVPLATRPELAFDSKVNEQVRRKLVHDKLAAAGAVRPDDIKKWLYKDVLRADLDDPMLGLGGLLNGNYPFAEEDRAAVGKR
jgi:hypothetical protein